MVPSSPLRVRGGVAPARKSGRGLKHADARQARHDHTVAPARKSGRGLKQDNAGVDVAIKRSARSKGRARIETYGDTRSSSGSRGCRPVYVGGSSMRCEEEGERGKFFREDP